MVQKANISVERKEPQLSYSRIKTNSPTKKKEAGQGSNVRVKKQAFRRTLIDDTAGTLVPYEILVAIRILLTMIPQFGYIHPDEYFQSLEIVNGDLLGYSSNRPWEYNKTFPIRSAAIPHLFYGLPMYFWRITSGYILTTFGYDIITPYFQLVLPRLIMCFFSFINDLCLFRISYTRGQNFKANMTILGSSYVMLVYGSRTFSNTIELFLSSLLTSIVLDTMANSEKLYAKDEYYKNCYDSTTDLKEKVKFHRLRCQVPWHTLSSVFSISTLIVVGTFNRPTFLAFAFVPVFFWLNRGLTRKLVSPLSEFHLRSAALVICALPTFVILVSIDSVYYEYIDIQSLMLRDFSLVRDFVVTPYNFIIYNANNTNLVDHGLHCRFTHFFVNVPLLFTVLGVIGIISIFTFIYKLLSVVKSVNDLPGVQSVNVMITCSYVVPLAALSIFPHQEPRFLLPCLLPLIFLHSKTLRSKKSLLYLWYASNLIFTIYYAFIQQAGVYGLIHRLHKEMEVKPRLTHVHVVTTHSYPIPISLLQLKYGASSLQTTPAGTKYQKSQDFFTYELGSSPMETTLIKLQTLKTLSEKTMKEKRLKYRLYFVLPTSLMYEFETEVARSNLTYEFEASFYPHFSMEAPPVIDYDRLLASCSNNLHRHNSDTCDISSRNSILSYLLLPISIVQSFFDQLGLAIVRIQ